MSHRTFREPLDDSTRVDLPSPWLPRAQFRAHALRLVAETGLHWRLVAAHVGVSPTAFARLVGTQPSLVHESVACAVFNTTAEEIVERRGRREAAPEARRLHQEILQLGYTSADLAPWLSEQDLRVLGSRSLYCSRALLDQVRATHDLVYSRFRSSRRRVGQAPAMSVAV